MWNNGPDRRDDPLTRERETHRLSRDEYDRPRYGSTPEDFSEPAREHWDREHAYRADSPPDPRGWDSDMNNAQRHPEQHASHDFQQRPPYVEERPYEARYQRVEDLPVHEIMTRRVTSVHPATSVERAARLMEECDCGGLPVIGDNGVLVGMITDRDIAIRVVARGRDPRHAIVADCMTERVFACYATESVGECMRQMSRHQVRRLPIVDDRGRLVGILAQSDLARHAGLRTIPQERRAFADVVSAVSQPTDRPYR